MLEVLVNNDTVERILKPLIEKGYYIHPTTGLYTTEGKPGGQLIDTPWVFTNSPPGLNCHLFQVISGNCGFVPSRCLDCWKVVVNPRTLDELFSLLRFQRHFSKDRIGTGHFCKCGIEERDYVHASYGGYFYCKSLEHGRHRYAQVREAMDLIDPEIPVKLKRHCTEMELNHGPTNTYEPPEGWKEFEALIMSHVDLTWYQDFTQSPHVQDHIIQNWIKWAWARTDPTAEKYNDDGPLYTPSVTYHANDNAPLTP